MGKSEFEPSQPSIEPVKENTNKLLFQGVEIQWIPDEWHFETPEGKTISKTAYSVWNPDYWPEIASRLAGGERCAMQIAGAYGIGMIFEDPSLISTPDSVYTSQFKKMEEVKKGRRPSQNFVVFVRPQDQDKLIAKDKLNDNFQHLSDPDRRNNAHAWASHLIYPYNTRAKIDEALIKSADNSVALFWIKGHPAFEGISQKIAEIKTSGQLGGGSLNYHGELPSFNAEDLKAKIAARSDWQKSIDFILLDELVEQADIARSQPMISFTGNVATLIRHGSMSLEEYQRRTGYDVVEIGYPASPNPHIKYASSSTTYTPENNKMIDQRIKIAEGIIADFKHRITHQM